MKHITDGFLNWLYDNMAVKPDLATCPAERFEECLEGKRAALKRAIGTDVLEKIDFAPSYVINSETDMDGYSLIEADITTLPKLVTPVYILKPLEFSQSVIYAHGHGRGAIEVVDGLYAGEYQKCLPITLAREGCLVVVPNLVGFGPNVMRSFNRDDERGCYANSTQFLMYGLTMTAVRVNQVMQIIGYFKDKGVAPVLAGISGGGLVTAFAAALSRDIKGAFISGYANTFKDSIMSLMHCVDNFMPGILSVGEEPEIISMAYPAPLLISNGEEDEIFPVSAAVSACDYVRSVYGRFGLSGLVTSEIFAGGHMISTEALLPWLKTLSQ